MIFLFFKGGKFFLIFQKHSGYGRQTVSNIWNDKKVREFALHGFKEGSGNDNEDKDIGGDPIDVHVDQGSNFRLMSQSSLQYKNVTLVEDMKPIYGSVHVK